MLQELITNELSTQEITIMENKKNDATSAQTPKKKKSNWMMISLAVLLQDCIKPLSRWRDFSI